VRDRHRCAVWGTSALVGCVAETADEIAQQLEEEPDRSDNDDADEHDYDNGDGQHEQPDPSEGCERAALWFVEIIQIAKPTKARGPEVARTARTAHPLMSCCQTNEPTTAETAAPTSNTPPAAKKIRPDHSR
jgi:hypothetical protein